MNSAIFTSQSLQIIENAQKISENKHNQFVEPEHLLLSLLQDDNNICSKLFEISKIDKKSFISEINYVLPNLTTTNSIGGGFFSKKLENIFDACETEVNKKNKQLNKNEFITPDLLLLITLEKTHYKQFLDINKIKNNLKELQKTRINFGDENKKQVINPLTLFGIDLTEMAKKDQLEPVIGREEEIRRTIEILLRKHKNNPVIIGEPGVGKTAIVEALAQKIVKNNVPEGLKNKKIISLQISSLLAGASYKGDFEKRLKEVIEEVKNQNNEVILFIDELHTIVGTGKSSGGVDASNMLKPALARGELRIVGATTLNEYRLIEKDGALERRFQPVIADEPNNNEAIAILMGIKERYELFHGVSIDNDALITAVNLSSRYIADRKLPDKAIDLIDESAAKVRMELDSYPEEIEHLESQALLLSVEKEGLIKEMTNFSQQRLFEIDQELKRINDTILNLKTQWQSEREILLKIREVQRLIDQEKRKFEQAKDSKNPYSIMMAKIKYNELPKLEAELEEYKKQISNSKFIKLEVTSEVVAQIVSKWTKIPVSNLMYSEKQKLLNLESFLHQHIIGQNEAIIAVANAIRRNKAGLKDITRPIGSFIFLGPTGVGKTELAKILANYLFDNKNALVKIDMSEYMEKYAVSKLIGPPPGYVGYEEGGQLTEKIRRNPYSVVLFDEIEKADPELFNVLLQVLDEGRLTDGQGRTVDFKNTILILTSNLGASKILDIKKNFDQSNSEEEVKEYIMELLKKHFSPEFLNRLDDIVIFKSLSKEEIKQIITLQINQVVKKLREEKLDLQISMQVIDYLLETGFDPDFGARTIKRVITKELENPIAEIILAEKVQKNQIITVNYNNGLIFGVKN